MSPHPHGKKLPWKASKSVWMWHLETGFSSERGNTGLTLGKSMILEGFLDSMTL